MAQPDAAWQLASKRDGHLVELLRAVPLIPAGGDGGKLRDALFTPVAAIVKDDDRTRAAAALGALGYTRPDAATFGVIAQGLTAAADIGAYASAIRSLRAIPEAAWPADAIAPLARAMASKVASLPPEARTEADTLDVVQFGERLSAKLPGDTGTALRRDLRALGVQVVRIQAIPEKLTFDLRWFAVEAGKPVQIVLVNPDAMPHNLVVGRPGSLEAIGTAGGAMPMPTDPAVKPFVPASPQVLFATNLVKEGDTERLAVTAPKVPGEYIFVCTFPGHWVTDVRRDAGGRKPRGLGSQADDANRSRDEAAVHLAAQLTMPGLFSGAFDWRSALIALGPTLVIAVVVALLIKRVVERLLKAALGDHIAVSSPHVRAPLRLVAIAAFVITAALIIVPALELAGLQTRGLTVRNLADWLLAHGVRVVVIALIGYAIVRTTSLLVRRFEHQVSLGTSIDALERAKRARTLGSLVERVASITVTIVSLLMILDQVGVNIAPALTGAGIAGLAVGFGAQALVRDIISGFFLILEDQVRVGDVASINGVGGLVEEINLRTIVLRDEEGAVHFFPNGSITTLANRSKDHSVLRHRAGAALQRGPRPHRRHPARRRRWPAGGPALRTVRPRADRDHGHRQLRRLVDATEAAHQDDAAEAMGDRTGAAATNPEGTRRGGGARPVPSDQRRRCRGSQSRGRESSRSGRSERHLPRRGETK